MRVVIRRVSYRLNRRKRAHAEVPDGGAAQDTAESDERVDETVEDKRAIETRRMLGARLLDRMKGDDDVLEYFRVARTQDLEPSELADALEWKVEKVHLVRKGSTRRKWTRRGSRSRRRWGSTRECPDVPMRVPALVIVKIGASDLRVTHVPLHFARSMPSPCSGPTGPFLALIDVRDGQKRPPPR